MRNSANSSYLSASLDLLYGAFLREFISFVYNTARWASLIINLINFRIMKSSSRQTSNPGTSEKTFFVRLFFDKSQIITTTATAAAMLDEKNNRANFLTSLNFHLSLIHSLTYYCLPSLVIARSFARLSLFIYAFGVYNKLP